jgi:hypothetical protein
MGKEAAATVVSRGSCLFVFFVVCIWFRYWLSRGSCFYGKECRFVHPAPAGSEGKLSGASEPSEAVATVVRGVLCGTDWMEGG